MQNWKVIQMDGNNFYSIILLFFFQYINLKKFDRKKKCVCFKDLIIKWTGIHTSIYETFFKDFMLMQYYSQIKMYASNL